MASPPKKVRTLIFNLKKTAPSKILCTYEDFTNPLSNSLLHLGHKCYHKTRIQGKATKDTKFEKF